MSAHLKKFLYLISTLLFLFVLFSSNISVKKVYTAGPFYCLRAGTRCTTAGEENCTNNETAQIYDDGEYRTCEDYSYDDCPSDQFQCIPYCSGDNKGCYSEVIGCPEGYTLIYPAICTDQQPVCCQKLSDSIPDSGSETGGTTDDGIPDSDTQTGGTTDIGTETHTDSTSSIVDIDALIKSIPGFRFAENSSLGNIVSTLLPYLYAITGFGLLLYLIAAGFSFLTSSGDPKKIEAAKGRLTNAIIGFALVFGAFWITQIVNYIFGLGVPLQ